MTEYEFEYYVAGVVKMSAATREAARAIVEEGLRAANAGVADVSVDPVVSDVELTELTK